MAWSNDAQIVGRHFGKNGSPTGEVFVLAEHDPSWFFFDIAMVDLGEFITVWEDYPHVSARRFGPDGQPAGPAFQVSDTLAGSQPKIATNTAGEFVVAWVSHETQFFGKIFARRYDDNDQPLDKGFQVNTIDLGGDTWTSDVALNDVGVFVIGWAQSGRGFARYFDASGPLRGEVLVAGVREFPPHFELDMDASGHSILFSDTSTRVRGVLLANGLPAGSPFLLAPPPAPAKPMDDPDVAMSPDGDFMVVWEQRPPDTVIQAVLGQRFTIDLPEDCSGPSAGISITSVQLPGNTPLVIVTLEDPNPVAEVTGYNLYYSKDPSVPREQWSLMSWDLTDTDEETSGIQLRTGIYEYFEYFYAAAYDSTCPAEGPR